MAKLASLSLKIVALTSSSQKHRVVQAAWALRSAEEYLWVGPEPRGAEDLLHQEAHLETDPRR